MREPFDVFFFGFVCLWHWDWDLDVLIHKISFESGPQVAQVERGPGIECFPCAARIVNILVQDSFYFQDCFQKKSCLFFLL